MESTEVKQSRDLYDTLFNIGMWWRIVYGIFRLILGLVLLKMIGTSFSDLFLKMMSHEVTQDPDDFLFTKIEPLARHLSYTVTYFVAIYFIFWGSVDAFLSINILRKKLWAFKVSFVLIIVFVMYEIHRFTYTHSKMLGFIILVDLILIWLIWNEEKRLEKIVVMKTNENKNV